MAGAAYNSALQVILSATATLHNTLLHSGAAYRLLPLECSVLSNDRMVYRFTARAMLAGYRDIEPLYTPEGVLENQPGQFEWFLVHQAGFPKLGVQEVLWVLSCGRFRIHWNMLSDSDTELWVSSMLQQCDHLCINTPA